MFTELNLLLEKMGRENDGTNHGSEYTLVRLPPADSLAQALDLYFSAMSTSNSPAVPAENWKIKTNQLNNADQRLRSSAEYWFFQLEFSPEVDPATSTEVLDRFMELLQATVGDADVYEVTVEPPMWYECSWQVFAFDAGSKRWLLHLGFSD